MFKINKMLSVATLITDGEKILLGKVTGTRGRYDFPKGIVDNNEKLIETAKREAFEETGLELDINNLKPLGIYKYLKNKDLAVFVYFTNMDKINIDNLYCESTFIDKYGNEKPEICGYEIVDIKNIDLYINKSLFDCFKNFIEPDFKDLFQLHK